MEEVSLRSVEKASQSLRPQAQIKCKTFLPAACTSAKILLGSQTCERKRVRCGEPQPFQTRAQRSGSRLRACQKFFFDKLRLCFRRNRATTCRRSLAEFAPAGANKVQSIFAGGVYVGKNTSRLANVRAKRVRCGEPQPFQTTAQRSGSRLRACQKFFFDKLRLCFRRNRAFAFFY